MTDNVEFRSVIKFLLLKQTNSQEIINQLQDAYKSECPCKATIYNWIREFKSGRTSVFNSEKSGRPVEVGDEKKEILKQIIITDRRIATRDLAQRLNISKGTLHMLLNEMGIRKMCSRFVPRFLTGDMQQRRLECCQKNLDIYKKLGDAFLKNIITEDETPLSLYIPESKRESAEWKMPGEKPTLKMRTGTSHKKCLMLTIFWDMKGIIKVDFAASDVKINSDYYAQLIKEIRGKRQKRGKTELWLLHDNAPIHTSHLTKATIDSCGLSLVPHPPYSPDLAPSDFHFFRQLKKDLRGKLFDCAFDLQHHVTDLLNSYSKTFYEKGILDLLSRWQKCVEVGGGYIEK